ncbi:MAG: hypothetical protein ACRCVX_02360 [Shewanella sp.]
MIVSPDTEQLLEAMSIIDPNFNMVPEDLDGAIDRMIREIGTNELMACSGKPSEFKRGFIIGYAQSLKK